MAIILSAFCQLFVSFRDLVFTLLKIQKEKKRVFRKLPGTNTSYLTVTKRITLLSTVSSNSSTLTGFKLDQQQEKPLVVLLSWLSAKRQHTYKYADIWIAKGFDVLIVTITVSDLLWPVRGTHVVAANTLQFLDENKCYSRIILYGLSAGGYEWAEVMIKMLRNMDRYRHILDRIIGQVWDSVVDMEEVPKGVSKAVFPKNKFLASAVLNYMLFHLKICEKIATRYHRAASQRFHKTIVIAPALLIFSRSDPIGTESTSKLVRKNWENRGIKVDLKIFEKSPHVGHLRMYPEEYIAALHGFLVKHNLSEHVQTQNETKTKLNKCLL